MAFLLYHEIALQGRELCESEPGYVRYVLDAPQFEAQMLAIKQAGLEGVSVSSALEFPSRAVGITFDDGCETDLLVAAPLLKKLGFGATFYVTSGRVGQNGYMSASQLREICGLGFEIGCHSMTHPFLTDLDRDGLRREIVEAKDRLEHFIAQPVHHFSCPGGRHDARVIEMARDAGIELSPPVSPEQTRPVQIGMLLAVSRLRAESKLAPSNDSAAERWHGHSHCMLACVIARNVCWEMLLTSAYVPFS